MMTISRPTAFAALILTLGTAGCQPGDDAPAAGGDDTEAAALELPPLDDTTEARVRTQFDTRLTEVEATLGTLPGLIASIRQDMRRNLNAAHVAAAQRNGVGPVRDSSHLEALIDAGQLVRLPDSTQWWVLRELDESLPYVTPGTREALEEIGRRFHERLHERALPPFRLDVTSVLRTSQQQADLRRRNRNASGTTSSHEFGTTLDIAYLSFAAPQAVDHPTLLGSDAGADRLSEPLRRDVMTALDTLATRYAPHIEGELGAVLQQLQRDGTVLPLRERSQPVFHITVARDIQ